MWYSRIARYYDNGQAFWINSVGDIFDTDGETHHGWIFSNEDYLDNKEGLFTELISELSEQQDEYYESEIRRINEILSDPETYDDPEYVKRLKNDLELYQSQLGSFDASEIKSSSLVDRLIQKGWIRKVFKFGNIYYEFFEEHSVNIIEDDLYMFLKHKGSTFSPDIRIILEDLKNRGTYTFLLADFLNSGEKLLDWLHSGDNKIIYEHGLKNR